MSDTPRVNIVLGKSVGPLAAAGSQEEFTAALKATMQSLIAEAKSLERELHASRAVLKLIAEAGGTTDDEGCSCNGLWCGEQARTFLDSANPSRQPRRECGVELHGVVLPPDSENQSERK